MSTSSGRRPNQNGRQAKNRFSDTMKLSELADTNPDLLGILLGFGIPLGFGEATVGEVCHKHGIDPTTFLLICEVYTFDGWLPDEDTLADIELHDLLRYLRRSHIGYSTTAISRLQASLYDLLEPCDTTRRDVILRFWSGYKDELDKHFAYEETTVFPYVETVLNGEGRGSFSMSEFEENHSDIEEKLGDLSHIIMKYLPSECDSAKATNLLHGLYNICSDLRKHTLIEDSILVPAVIRLEDKMAADYRNNGGR